MLFGSFSSRSSLSSLPRRQFAGILEQRDKAGKVVACKRIYSGHEIIIGRDKSRCQYVIDEPTVSNKHIRIYTIVYDNDNPDEIAPLVYAEDLSRNGTYWNGSLIGKGNGGFLLSDGDSLRLNPQTYFSFRRTIPPGENKVIDSVQAREIEHFKKDYNVTNRILGSGAHGKVFMAIESNPKSQLACKMVDLRRLRPRSRVQIGRLEQPAAAQDVDSRVQLRKVKVWVEHQQREGRLEIELERYYREVEILAAVNHPNIIGLEKVYVTDNTLYIFQDLITGGDLFSYIEYKNGKLLEVEAAVIIRQVLTAVDYLHDNNIVHRDIKPDNILMTSLAAGSRVVLTDFGAARLIDERGQRMSSLVGTEGYTAPEISGPPKLLRCKRGYTRAIDMWSVGCLSVILLTGAAPFCDPKTHVFSERLAQECDLTSLESLPEWQEVRAKPKAFVKGLLVLDEAERLTAKTALTDPWFSNELHKANFEELYQRTTRHWRHRISQAPIIEFFYAESIQQLLCSQKILDIGKRGRRRGSQMPVEPPYKPFPRNMHAPLFPKRSNGSRMMSDEVRTAIENHWTLKQAPRMPKKDENDLLPPYPASLRQRAATLSDAGDSSPTPNVKGFAEQDKVVPATPRSRPFKRLQPRNPLKSIPPANDQRTRRPVTLKSIETYSPTAWDQVKLGENADAAPEPTARPPTPRPKPARLASKGLVLRPADRMGDEKSESKISHVQPVDIFVDDNFGTFSGNEVFPRSNHFPTSTPSTARPSSGLKRKSIPNLPQQLNPVSSSSKRRRNSIFDLDEDDNIQCTGEPENEEKKPKIMLQTAKAYAASLEDEMKEEAEAATTANGQDRTPRSGLIENMTTGGTGTEQLYLPRV